jgi:hypothetical protein
MTYELLNIYHNSTSDIRNEIINLWIRNNALNELEASERVNHVVHAIREKTTSQIIGVSTARLNYLPNTQELYYFYGMFIDKNHRGKRPWLLKRTYDLLNEKRTEKNAQGLAAILENKKIPHQLFDRYNWTKFKCNEIENAIFFKQFND